MGRRATCNPYRIDPLDSVPCHINYAIVNAPAYVTTDGEAGIPAWLQGYGPDVRLSACFRFDDKTCPMSLHHGGTDEYSPNGSTLIYHRLRKMNIPAELHLYPNKGHGAYGLDRGVEFLRQIGIMGSLDPEVDIMTRYASDEDRKEVVKQDPNGFEVAPARRLLNQLGMTVVTLRYRTPRPKGLSKHITAWEDLQRTIRLVRSQAAAYGLDPDQIGIMGSSAGGHLTLMGLFADR